MPPTMNEQFLIIACTLFFPPLFLLVFVVLVLATFGKSLGIRKKYVQVLRKIFQWGRSEMRLQRQMIRSGSKARGQNADLTTSSDDPLSETSENEFEPTVSTIFERGNEANNDENSVDSEEETEEGVGEVLEGERRASTDRASEGAVSTEGPSSYIPKQSARRTRKRTIKLIERDATERIIEKLDHESVPAGGRVWTVTDDSLDFIKSGIEAIVEDEVTRRFYAEELVSWNLLTRTTDGLKYQHVSWRLSLVWALGVVFRYGVLFPARLLVLAVGGAFLLVSTAVIGYLPSARLRDWAYCNASIVANRICSRAISAIINFHERENLAQRQGICVANHTSPIDAMVLGCDHAYSFIGQSHGGLLGMIQRALSRAADHIWFERSEVKDREKGSFEVDAVIYPVAIKYDPTFGDAFWNSSQQAWVEYMIMMMTSWAIVADVWYLPPMRKQPSESAIAFASRVKHTIAHAGGLVDLEWDGALKRIDVPDKLRARQQQLYSERLARVRSSTGTSAASDKDRSRLDATDPAHQNILEEVFDDEEVNDPSKEKTE